MQGPDLLQDHDGEEEGIGEVVSSISPAVQECLQWRAGHSMSRGSSHCSLLVAGDAKAMELLRGWDHLGCKPALAAEADFCVEEVLTEVPSLLLHG